MSKPKWKSTQACVYAIEGMGCAELTVSRDEDFDVEKWEDAEYWIINIGGVRITTTKRYYYEDEAANAAYQFAWKYLRKKRPVKRAKREGGK